jgi:hypothetical protein
MDNIGGVEMKDIIIALSVFLMVIIGVVCYDAGAEQKDTLILSGGAMVPFSSGLSTIYIDPHEIAALRDSQANDCAIYLEGVTTEQPAFVVDERCSIVRQRLSPWYKFGTAPR